MGKKLDKILEGYKPIPMKRMFYPRGMKLSEDFINAYHREYDRLVGEGQNPRSLAERFNKALKFHINDPRKYQQIDEEQNKKKKKPTAAGFKHHNSDPNDPDDRRTKQGDHLPGPEGSSPGSYHSRPDSRKVKRG
tara:strand:- start:189 stop:593 length:405 start_codon:yes stop_codon:yes gene_type:complete